MSATRAAPATPPRVGIVLVNYNGQAFMPDCLAALARRTYGNATVVVVDNASTDGSPAWVRAHHPDVSLIELAANTGVTGGNNAGIRWCLEHGCDHVLLLNNDTVVRPDFLEPLVEAAGPDVMTVPKIYFHDRPEVINNHFGGFSYLRGVHVDWYFGRRDTRASRRRQDAPMANTCALLVPRPLLERVGLMDEAYFLYYDDADFITRAVRAGATVRLVPEAVIYHRESSSTGGAAHPLQTYYGTRNRLYFMFKHERGLLRRAAFLAFFGLTRLPRLGALHLRRRPDLAAALRHGVEDFARGRMGRAAPDRYAPRPRP